MTSKDFVSLIQVERCDSTEFLRLSHEFCALLNQIGIDIIPSRTPHNLKFNKRSLAHQKKVIAYLDMNISILKECIADGHTDPTPRLLLWKLFKKIGSAPSDDLFDKILDDDLVEVYFTDHTPIFRSTKFYRETSYTVDEALCSTWYGFCRRNIVITLKLMKTILNFIRKDHHQTLSYNLPSHNIDELGTEREYRHWMTMKYISGAHKNGKLTAVISVSSITNMGSLKEDLAWA